MPVPHYKLAFTQSKLAFWQLNNAATHYRINHADLSLILALVRGRTLARAAELLKVDVSTVFRASRKLEAALATSLFEKSRAGYQPTSAALILAQQAESAEQALELAQISLEHEREVVSGTVRLTCTEAMLQSLLLPALSSFIPNYPGLRLELNTSSSFANLSRRDADIALRLTNTPPEHLVGTRLAAVSYVVCASSAYLQRVAGTDWANMDWIAPDDFLPDHPTVAWRRKQWPAINPIHRCSSMLAVAQMVKAGMGIAALPDFTQQQEQLQVLSGPLDGCNTELWLLTRPDCRSLRSVSTLFSELSRAIGLQTRL